ncbi:hypothetical protein [Prevotella sp. E2-28]|uniref:hypothetical protein n=1 Tax=Prevotella sp. E2-28 TaxID=2913620 RepID=UPI001EDA3E31|nr:hypothetical protein [Prevotella sp. E2-28]UKK52697.1 hypothetical protein L6465_08775 [Prevotella sp. E2-28]
MKENVMNISEKFVAVENAKVANIKYKYYHVGTEGLLGDNGNVVKAKVTAVSFDLRKQDVVTVLTDANGKEYIREGEFYLYGTLDDFKSGHPFGRKIVAAWELLQWAGGDKTINCETLEIDIDEEKGTSNTFLAVWISDNGDVIKTPVKVDAVTWDANGKHIESGNLPDVFFDSKEEAYKWTPYSFTDEDGDTFKMESAELRLAPTDAQRDAIKGITDAFKVAYDAGLMVFVNSDGLLQVFNSENVVSNTKDVDKSMLCGDTVCLAYVELSNVDVKLPVNAGGVSIRLKPTERQLKEWKKNHPDA